MSEEGASKEVTCGKDKMQHDERFAKNSRQDSAGDISQRMANLEMNLDDDAKAEASEQARGSTSSESLPSAGSSQQPLRPPVNDREVNAPKEVPGVSVPPRTSPDGVDETDATPTNMPHHSDPIPLEAATHGSCQEDATVKDERIKIMGKDDLENQKDLILFELAEKLSLGCDLRGLALYLQLTEVDVSDIERSHQDNRRTKFYKVLRRHWEMSSIGQAHITLISVLESLKQYNAASWLRQKTNQPPLEINRPPPDSIKEKEASLQGEKNSSIVSHDPPSSNCEGATGGQTSIEYYDIFIIQTRDNDDLGTQTETERVREICLRHGWKCKVQGNVLGEPVLKGIERLLKQASHLLVIITDSDCVGEENETSLTIEMAFQLAFNMKNLSRKIIPVRCCEKRKLPLPLQSLTGIHIDDPTIEENLERSIDTSQRIRREREHCD